MLPIAIAFIVVAGIVIVYLIFVLLCCGCYCMATCWPCLLKEEQMVELRKIEAEIKAEQNRDVQMVVQQK